MSRFNVYPVDDTLCLSHYHSLSLSSVCSPTHSPTYQSFTHPFITFLLYFSHSFSLACTCVRARVSLSPSFSRFSPYILSEAFCLSLSFSFTHTLTHMQSHALSHPLTHKRTHAPNLYPHLSRSLTHISVSSFLSLPLSLFLFFLSFSLSLSLSISYTHTLIHTHIHTHTLSHLFSCSSTHSLWSRVHAALSSAHVRARALFSLFLSPFLPFLFLSFVILSLLLSSSPLARLLFCCLSLTRSLPLFFNSW